MAEKEINKNSLNDKIRIVTGMVEDLDKDLKIHFYKSMLTANVTGNYREQIFKEGNPRLQNNNGELSHAEYALINEIAISMDEINFLLNFESLLLNP
ncbi:MAG: hypothetical protein IPJ79_06815 [Bacteroidetes bacterium]|nr:hypothetical protein [Bacteroidota bacterium]